MLITRIESVANIMDNWSGNVSDLPGVYRWWFPEKDVTDLLDKCNFCKKRLQYRKIKGEYYVALYFGESGNLRRRFKNHINGPEDKSTLRRTIVNIFTKFNMTDDIDLLLRKCYLEWLYLCKKCVAQSIEAAELSSPSYYYPFNKTDHVFANQSADDVASICSVSDNSVFGKTDQ